MYTHDVEGFGCTWNVEGGQSVCVVKRMSSMGISVWSCVVLGVPV